MNLSLFVHACSDRLVPTDNVESVLVQVKSVESGR